MTLEEWGRIIDHPVIFGRHMTKKRIGRERKKIEQWTSRLRQVHSLGLGLGPGGKDEVNFKFNALNFFVSFSIFTIISFETFSYGITKCWSYLPRPCRNVRTQREAISLPEPSRREKFGRRKLGRSIIKSKGRKDWQVVKVTIYIDGNWYL